MREISDSIGYILVPIANWLPQLFGALIILLVGYIIAKTIEGLTKKILRHTKFDAAIGKGTGGSYVARIIASPTNLLGSIVFWLLWLTALSISISVLGVPALNSFIQTVYGYVPNVIAALLIFVVAGAISTATAAIVTKVMGETATGKLIATIIPILVMLIATFMILNQLQIAKEIVIITYAVLTGAAGLGLALAFGLGGRDVASRILDQAYTKGQASLTDVGNDIAAGKAKAKNKIADSNLGDAVKDHNER